MHAAVEGVASLPLKEWPVSSTNNKQHRHRGCGLVDAGCMDVGRTDVGRLDVSRAPVEDGRPCMAAVEGMASQQQQQTNSTVVVWTEERRRGCGLMDAGCMDVGRWMWVHGQSVSSAKRNTVVVRTEERWRGGRYSCPIRAYRCSRPTAPVIIVVATTKKQAVGGDRLIGCAGYHAVALRAAPFKCHSS